MRNYWYVWQCGEEVDVQLAQCKTLAQAELLVNALYALRNDGGFDTPHEAAFANAEFEVRS